MELFCGIYVLPKTKKLLQQSGEALLSAQSKSDRLCVCLLNTTLKKHWTFTRNIHSKMIDVSRAPRKSNTVKMKVLSKIPTAWRESPNGWWQCFCDSLAVTIHDRQATSHKHNIMGLLQNIWNSNAHCIHTISFAMRNQCAMCKVRTQNLPGSTVDPR